MKDFLKSKYRIVLILILGLILRLVVINQSLWLDEAIGAEVVKQQSYSQILWEFPKSDNHPPLYYLTLKAWTNIFGYSEAALRSLSVLFGVLTIYLIYKIAKIISVNKGTSADHFPFIATLLITTSAFHIYYSQEARMYSMAAFLASLAMYSFLILTGNKRQEGTKFAAWLLYSFSIVALVFTDYVPVFLFPVFWLYAFSKKFSKSWQSKFFLSHIPLLALGVLWFPIFRIQSEHGNWLLNTLPSWRIIAGGATFKQAILVWTKFSLGRISFYNKLFYYLLIVFTSVPFMILFIRAWVSREKIKIIWLWLTLPLLIGFVVSFWFPAFVYFRFLFVVPAFYLLISWGLSQIKTKKIKSLLIVCLIAVNVGGWLVYVGDKHQQREQWRNAVNFIESRAKKDDLILFEFPEPFAPYKWYSGDIVQVFGATDSISAKPGSYEKTKKIVEGYNGVYYFEYLYDLTDPNQYVEKALADSGFVSLEIYTQFHGVGSISYYKRP